MNRTNNDSQESRPWYGRLSDYEGPKVPVQVRNDYQRLAQLPEPLVRLAWEAYFRRHKSQTFERLHERGGFGLMEIVALLADNAEFWKRRAQNYEEPGRE